MSLSIRIGSTPSTSISDSTLVAGTSSIAAIRAQYADEVTARAGSPAIREAFATVPRERFLGPGPWKIFEPGVGYLPTRNADPAHIYRDVLVALDAEAGINNGQPSLHAICIEALDLTAGGTGIHVGCGTGYYTAILSELVGPTGSVQGWEREPTLAEIAAENLADRPNASVVAASATEGTLPAADAIYVSAGASTPVRTWVDALRPGGRLLFPLVGSGGRGGMLLVTRRTAGFAARLLTWAQFIPCAGAQDARDAAVLNAAFKQPWDAVHSLRFDSDPDDTAWVAGSGWWLSTAAVD